jgi:ABC-type glycerol-3-phosphate transport system substrate-binding protein
VRRRDLLRDGAIMAGVSLLASCSITAQRTPRTQETQSPLTIADDFCDLHKDAISSQWNRTHRIPLEFRHTPGAGQSLAGIDVAAAATVSGRAFVGSVPVSSTSVVVLDPYIKRQNFALSTLVPNAITPFRDPQGNLLGLPLYVQEYQLYVNEEVLPGGGTHKWTFEDMASALNDLVTRSGMGPLGAIVGQGWAEMPNFLPALILGWTDSLFLPDGRFNVPHMRPCLEFLVPFARTYGWRPTIGPTLPSGYLFLRDGFTGPAAKAGFAFDLPWLVHASPDFRDNLTQHRITIASFPVLPRGHIVPAVPPTGLVVPSTSQHPETAVQFILWLLAHQQQQLLIHLGVPPVVSSPDLASAWATQATQMLWPAFDQQGYTDMSAQVARAPVVKPTPNMPPIAWAYVVKAVQQMYQTGDVSTQLSELEMAL